MAHPTATDARETFENLTEGDRIELPNYYDNPMTVSFVAGGFVGLKDDNGNERELIQDIGDPTEIGLVVGLTDKGSVAHIRRVDGDDDDSDDDSDENENAQDCVECGKSIPVGMFDACDDCVEPDDDVDDDPTFDADEETVTDDWEGAFIYTSWGYGQTNVEYAQIIDVSDTGLTVLARLVTAETVDSVKGSESTRPSAEQYGEEFRLHVRNSGGDPAFRGSYPYVSGDPDDGQRKGSFLPFGGAAGKTVHRTPPNHGH